MSLITYTPRYHELEYIKGKTEMVYTPAYYTTPGQTYMGIPITFQYKEGSSTYNKSITIYCLYPPGPLSDQQKEYVDSWYPVYGFITTNRGYPAGRILDNYGNILQFPSGTNINGDFSKPTIHIMGALLPAYSKSLPDSFIDAKLKQMACHQMTQDREWPNQAITFNLPQESMFKVKPVPQKMFRSFEPTSDLADYILELEKKAGIQKLNAEMQTNRPISKNQQGQTNKVSKNAEGQTNLTAPTNMNVVLGSTSTGTWAEPAGRNFSDLFLTAVEPPKRENKLHVNNI